MSSKRSTNDCADDIPPPTNPSGNMRRDQNALPSPLSHRFRSGSAASRLMFFVRTLSDCTLVIQADPRDTIISVHEEIESMTGLPVIEQCLIYRGKQLQWEQTLSDCGVHNDAGLHVVARMRSTDHPQAWQLVNEIVSQVFYRYKNKNNPPSPTFSPATPPKTVESMLLEFLSMTPMTNSNQASGHLQIFSDLSAPAALVMLYTSSYKPNQYMAYDAIAHFITSCKSILPKKHYHLCVPITLAFCRLLSTAVGIGDPLYNLCRSRLGKMVEVINVGEKKGSVGVHDVFPFLEELAGKLSHNLVKISELGSFLGTLFNDVQDFLAFVAPVRNGIKKDIGFPRPIRVPLSEELCRLPLREEIIVLHGIFFDLLSKLEKCMVKIEGRFDLHKKSEVEAFEDGCQYLHLLKELNSTSQLYQGCEEVFWEIMKQRKRAVCYLIVRCSNRSDDHRWISDCKEVTNFEARRHLAMMLLPEVKDDFDELHEMFIDRSYLLSESFEYIVNADLESLRSGLIMEFKNEEATGPGVLREWFLCVCQAIFNPQNPLFVACPNDRRRFFPNPASTLDPLNREYFNFVGKVIALALMHKVQVGIVLDRVFFLRLAGQPITLEDIQDADPTLYTSCKQILEMDPEAVDQDVLGLTFVDEIEELGTRRVVELCPGGKSLSVDSRNRKKYVDSLIEHRFMKETAEQVAHFAKGFSELLSCGRLLRTFFRCLELGDLDRMLYGSEGDISVDDWWAHTEYHGFKDTDDQISWFWKIVENMTKEQKRVLLFFWTSIKHLPCEGFSGLASRLYIYKNFESTDQLPSSHTCFYRLCFPAYPTICHMREQLRIITQEHVGCSFGTW